MDCVLVCARHIQHIVCVCVCVCVCDRVSAAARAAVLSSRQAVANTHKLQVFPKPRETERKGEKYESVCQIICYCNAVGITNPLTSVDNKCYYCCVTLATYQQFQLNESKRLILVNLPLTKIKYQQAPM